jgi:hypothetical protein
MPRSNLIGKTILMGLTYCKSDGTLIDRKQLFGTVKSFSRKYGIKVVLDDGEEYLLPPDRSAIQRADKGEYHLRSTGKVVKDPDYLCSFTITKPSKH